MVTKKELDNWLDACNSHDVDRILKLFANNAVVHHPQNVIPLNKNKLRQFFTMLFDTYPCFQFKNEGFVIQGNEVASWETVIGTMINPTYDPATGNIIQPTGKTFIIPGAMRLIYDDKKLIKKARIYWDRLLLNQQLGLS